MTALPWTAAILGGWLAIAVPVAVVIGKTIDAHDQPTPRQPLDTMQPVDVPTTDLTVAEIDAWHALTDPLEAERDRRLS